MREQVEADIAATQAALPPMSDDAERNIEEHAGNASSMITSAIEDRPQEKVQKNAKVVVVVEHSCLVFSQEHPFREFCFKIVQNPMFDTAMFTTICVSSVVLALDTPYKPSDHMKSFIAIWKFTQLE